MKRSIIVFALWLLSVPIAVELPSAPSPGKTQGKNPPPPIQITPVDCKLTLAFASYNNRNCGVPPTNAANPALFDGAPSLSPLTKHTYYCKVTVEPNAPTTNYNAATYKFTWTKKGSYLPIKVPKECTSKITVEFYEDCNTCTTTPAGNLPSRPMFRYTAIVQKGQPYVNAFMQLLLLASC